MMLLINFYEKASVLNFVRCGQNKLMLFLWNSSKSRLMIVLIFSMLSGMACAKSSEVPLLYTNPLKWVKTLGNSHFKYAPYRPNRLRVMHLDTTQLNYRNQIQESDKLVHREQLAKQKLMLQDFNNKVYGGLGLLLIFGVIIYLFYKQRKFKIKQFQKQKKLEQALIKIKFQNRLNAERMSVFKDLHNTLIEKLSIIRISVEGIKTDFDIPDEKLTSKLDGISSCAINALQELRDRRKLINKI